jgi:hypothetical protein
LNLTGSRVDGYRRWVRAAGKRVQVQRVFSKKMVTDPSQTHTRVPVYLPIPGHGYEYPGNGHGFTGMDCTHAVFSKPLVFTIHFLVEE